MDTKDAGRILVATKFIKSQEKILTDEAPVVAPIIFGGQVSVEPNFFCIACFKICMGKWSKFWDFKYSASQTKIYTGWLLYGGPEKTKNCVKVVPPINKVPYQILECISLATQKHPDFLSSASHRHELAKRL